jgi:hypothetical protein
MVTFWYGFGMVMGVWSFTAWLDEEDLWISLCIACVFSFGIAVAISSDHSNAKESEVVVEPQTALESVWDWLTPREKGMLNAYYGAGYNGKGYEIVYNTLAGMRSTKNPVNTDAPFCDVVRQLDYVETHNTPDDVAWVSTTKGFSLLKQWEILKGEPLIVSCGVEGKVGSATVITPTTTQINTQVVDATVTLNEVALLSPSKVRELTNSAKECNRAKVELLSLTKDNRYLTIDDYESVTKLVLDCENLLMQIELNK